VAKAPKTKEKEMAALDELSFEDALEQLETIVDAMENESLPLEKLLEFHEKGVRLQQVCQNKLKLAEDRIVQLEKKGDGDFGLKPLTLEEDSE
jgi:exodeoxyribonuclease VII small subunit